MGYVARTDTAEQSACNVIELREWRSLAAQSLSSVSPLFEIHTAEVSQARWPVGVSVGLAALVSAACWTLLGGLIYLAV